jgi:glycosyltransferase involved in cell wall biosynthesis
VVGRGTGAEEALGAGGEPAGTAADTGDPAELADVLRTFLTSDDLRHRWRAAALASRERLPTWQSTAQTLAETCASAHGEVGQDVVAEHEAP